MNIGSIEQSATMMNQYQVGASGDNEAAERVPDNEAAEMSSARTAQPTMPSESGALAPYQATMIDTYA